MIVPHVNEGLEMFKDRLLWANKAYNYADETFLQDSRIQEIYHNGLLENSSIDKDLIVSFFLGAKNDNIFSYIPIVKHFYNLLSKSFKGGIMLDKKLWEKKKRNLLIFSALKTTVLGDNILKSKNRDNEKEYIKDSMDTYSVYDGSYLASEQETSFVNGRMAKSFKKFEDKKGEYPYLRYCTVLDNRVRSSHADLEGITKSVDSKFWDTYTPPLGYNCRCYLRQVKHTTETSNSMVKRQTFLIDKGNQISIANKEMSFRSNPYKTNYVFKPTGEGKHPYFTLANPDIVKDILKNIELK